jgi:hypothetical protein
VPLIFLLLDGARSDVFDAPFAAGELPELARLRSDGGLYPVTTAFPSVTGPAYAPFLTGRFPGPIGLPGLRWYDREHTRCRRPPHCRSYLGSEIRHVDGDVDASAPTLFELAPSRFAAMSMLARGATAREQMGRDARLLWRIARTHWRGDAAAWLDIDRVVSLLARTHIAQRRPDVSFVALLGLDKTSHATGHTSPDAHHALRILDDLVGHVRGDLERAGRWESTHLWIGSDHGHSPVHTHDDLADAVRAMGDGHRVLAHPWVFTRRPDVAVMVSGNAMAHVYLEPARRARPWWPSLRGRWSALADALLERPAVDLLLLPHDARRCEVRGRGRGAALVERVGMRFAYRPLTGDPLGLGEPPPLDDIECHAASLPTDYPDALVQIAHLSGAPRAGDVIVSATRGWDLRARYEPMPHVSTHGALHREHMLVPLMVNHPIARTPRRTADVMPSALRALGLPQPPSIAFDGQSFM